MVRFSIITAGVFLALVACVVSMEDWAQSLLDLENSNRAKHGAGKFEHSDELAKRAQKWADHLADNCKSLAELNHMPRAGNPDAQYKDGLTGENLWSQHQAGVTEFTEIKSKVPGAVKSWYGEIKDYSWDKEFHGQNPMVLHFTQEVWKDTKEVGYAVGKKKGCDRLYVVARYYPTGNSGGADSYKKNVGKAK